MLLTLFQRTEKFFKGLPVIRNIPGFSSLPPDITTRNLRFYKLGNLVYTLGWMVHGMWVFLFWHLGLTSLLWLNVASFGVYVACIVINRYGYHLSSAVLMVCEIIIHQVVAVRMLGWDAGFQYYVIVTGMLVFLMPKGQWLMKYAVLAACLVSYILMDHLLKNRQPLHLVDPGFLAFFRVSNITFAFASLYISGAYFNMAMHETETQLEESTQALVEAEKKATLGKIATEMAHEIQNPLNFVNNFSELNEELLDDLRKEMPHNDNTTGVKDLVENIRKNNERIKTNGQRVSAIVSTLQEQANKL